MNHKFYRPPLHKRLLKSAPMRGTFTFLIWLAVRVVFLTSRIRVIHTPGAEPYAHEKKPSIACCWHGRMLFMPLLRPKDHPVAALASRHGDGGLIASILGWFGVRTVRGSTSRGGDAALREMKKLAGDGITIVITPDGPRGPHQVAAPGAIWLASMTGLPIIPLGGSSSRRRHAKSWDAFTLPLPFGQIICEAGEPMFIPADIDSDMVETYRLELERRLTALNLSLDALVEAR